MMTHDAIEEGESQLGAPNFEVSVNWDDKRPIVRVRGEVDFATAPVLQQALKNVIDDGAEHITLDFHEVTFLDSEGLKVMLQAYRYLNARGGSMTVRGCSRFVARTFEILGLETHFGMEEELEENQNQV